MWADRTEYAGGLTPCRWIQAGRTRDEDAKPGDIPIVLSAQYAYRSKGDEVDVVDVCAFDVKLQDFLGNQWQLQFLASGEDLLETALAATPKDR